MSTINLSNYGNKEQPKNKQINYIDEVCQEK